MFRSAASLIAKKTAIVAITGVTVIGGATFALAVEADPSSTTNDTSSEITTLEDCVAASGTWDATLETCTPADPTATTPEEDCLAASGTWDATLETCTPADTEGGEGAVEDGADGDAVHPDNHGAAVSKAAKDCKTEMGEAKNHGQCVREVARNKGAEETVTEAPAEETVTEDPAPVVTEEPAETMTAPAETPAKGNAGGTGKGKKA